MPLTVVVGGQYGSEGKGKMVSQLAEFEAPNVAVVRCGGSNAGHTAEGALGRALLRQLPSGAVEPSCQLFLAAGMQLDLDALHLEIEQLHIEPSRLCIDPGAVVIESDDRTTERSHQLYHRIGSTLTGTGAAAARKVIRDPQLRRADDIQELRPFIGNVSESLSELLDQGHNVIVEGTQGAGLSLHHGPYPYTTGRDTTAAGFLSEAGLPPMRVTDVVMVLRTYPIRVGGPSGPLHKEISWDEVRQRSGYPSALAEYTTVTGRLRRIGEFDWPLAQNAIRLNGPTSLALHGADYLNHRDLGARTWEELSVTTRRFVERLERELGVPVHYVFTGPDGSDLVDRGKDHRLSHGSAEKDHSVRKALAS
ncbi:MAG: adenylosuccinate synthetase [Actinomycetota bacterium]